MLTGLLPELEEVWPGLLPVQQTDIFRYAVVYIFGGWYADSDVTPVLPIRQWGHGAYATLVVGVEAERVDDGVGGRSFDGPLDTVISQVRCAFIDRVFVHMSVSLCVCVCVCGWVHAVSVCCTSSCQAK